MSALVEKFEVSYVLSKHDNKPSRAVVTWPEFCAQFASPRCTACTVKTCGTGEHAEFDEKGKIVGCRHKNGRAWIPATFSTGRKKKNVDHVSMLVVDADHLPDQAALDLVLEKLGRYQYVVHGTHSDRDGNRCARIFLPLSRPVPGGDWPRFWPAAMAMLGVPADPSCCDAGRLYYLPARPSDADYFYVAHDGEPIDVMAVVASAPQQTPSVADSLEVDEDGKVKPGQRHAMLKSMAGALRHRGAGLAEIKAALRLANESRCAPPKSESQVDEIAVWAATQPISSLPPRRRDTDPSAEPQQEGKANLPEASPLPDFDRNKDGKIYSSQANLALALAKLGVRVRYDQFGDREIIEGLAGFGPTLDDAAMTRLRMRIDSEFYFRLSKDWFYDVVADQARHHSFHPVRDYLDGLSWDGIERIDHWLVDAGADDTEYVRAVSRIVLVAAVRRVRQPGCKFDEMPVIESLQGTSKSTAIAVLAVHDEWFNDDLPLGSDTKRQMEAMAGKWIVEAGELKGMSKGDVAALKGFLSRRVDEARMSYGRKKTVMPRQCVIIGTTNETNGYLKDTTGNRRFWPVKIDSFDVASLRRDRDQLWAEAVAAEAAGESIRLDPTLYSAAAVEQDARRVDDPFVMALDETLRGWTGKIRIVDCWRVVDVKPGDATQDQQARLGSAMRELGWERKRRRFDGDLEYAYVKGTEKEREQLVAVKVDEDFRDRSRSPRACRSPGVA